MTSFRNDLLEGAKSIVTFFSWNNMNFQHETFNGFDLYSWQINEKINETLNCFNLFSWQINEKISTTLQ